MKYFRVTLIISFILLSPTTFASEGRKLDTIIVTANPLGRSASEISQPVTVLAGDELVYKSQPTIGETLAKEPGIRSSYFGPGASRPVIRGLEGDQIMVLQNGVGNIDASAASVDHNVAIDPLTIERIEVVRGPAALLYGSRAVGGVVNVIDNRIPDQKIDEIATGMTDLRYNTANKERAGSILLEGGIENYAWHINGFKRITDDVDIPGFARSRRLRDASPVTPESKDRLDNSQTNSNGGAFGLSRFFDNDRGYVGASVTRFENNYGTVSSTDVTIDMDQTRFDFAGLYKKPIEVIKEVKFKAGLSEYKHTEFEGSVIGTVFKNDGYDGRLEFIHEKLGALEGAFGIQASKSDFSALGEEAFLPPTETKNNAVFILEEIPFDQVTFEIGARAEHQEISKELSSAFGVADSRQDATGSGSVGVVYKPIDEYAIALSTSYTQRAPNAQELYANGNHVATSTFEVGNRNLSVQKSTGVDLSLRKEKGDIKGEVNFFYNNFQDFIALTPTGTTDGDSGNPIHNYVNLPAEFFGAEAKLLFDAYKEGAHDLDFEVRGDYVEARNRKTGEPLPRISPARIGASSIYKYSKISLRLDADYTFSQKHTPSNERPTDGFFMLDFGADYKIDLGLTSSLLYVKATNLLNEEVRNHTSFIKDQAPLMGRSFMVGVRTAF